jgi:hypothetical protein
MGVGEVPPASGQHHGRERLPARDRTREMVAKSHLLVRPGSIFLYRPCSSCRHGAQGQVKAGRRAAPRRKLDASRPYLDRPSTVPPLREAVSILGMRYSARKGLRHPQVGRLEIR